MSRIRVRAVRAITSGAGLWIKEAGGFQPIACFAILDVVTEFDEERTLLCPFTPKRLTNLNEEMLADGESVITETYFDSEMYHDSDFEILGSVLSQIADARNY